VTSDLEKKEKVIRYKS